MWHCCKIDWRWEKHKIREWNCIYFWDTTTYETLSRISLILLNIFLYSNAWWTFTLPRQLVQPSFRLNTKVKFKTFHLITTLLHQLVSKAFHCVTTSMYSQHTNYTLSLGSNLCLSQTHHICHRPVATVRSLQVFTDSHHHSLNQHLMNESCSN